MTIYTSPARGALVERAARRPSVVRPTIPAEEF